MVLLVAITLGYFELVSNNKVCICVGMQTFVLNNGNERFETGGL